MSSDVEARFAPDANIGIVLGEPSQWLVDVDVDADDALDLADEILPATGAVTGRSTRPRTHRWYVCEGARTTQHRDTIGGGMVVEIRSTGGQTLVGPSVHPSGEPYDVLDGEPAVVSVDELEAAVARLHDAVMRKRHGDGWATPRKVSSEERSTISDTDLVRRAIAYLEAMPPAISGQGGHAATYAAATALVHGFGLDRDIAIGLLLDRYNPRCSPPWTEKELEHKVADAASKPHDRPFGWLKDQQRPMPSVEVEVVDVRHLLDEVPHPTLDPFPVELLDVPGLIGEFVRHCNATAHVVQPVLALAAGISLQAALAARKVRDRLGNRTNVYCVGVARSGWGKDHARSMVDDVLEACGGQSLRGEDGIASDAGLISALEQSPALLLQPDEFGRFLSLTKDGKRSPHLFAVRSLFMELYSRAGGVYHGKSYADRRLIKKVNQPCLVLHGTTTPTHYYEALGSEGMVDGFVARMMMFEAETYGDEQSVDAVDVPASIVQQAKRWIDRVGVGNLSGVNPEPDVVMETAASRSVFSEYRRRIRTIVADDTIAEAVTNSWSRATEKARRLALIYACSESSENPVIDAPAATWATRVVEHLTSRTLAVMDRWVSDSEFDARQKRVLRILHDAGGSLTRSELTRRTRQWTRRQRDEVIENMVDTKQINMTDAETGGRKATIVSIA